MPESRLARRVVLATHYYATGPALELEQHLKLRTKELLFIAHPLFAGGGDSYVRHYTQGRLAEIQKVRAKPPGVRFLTDVAQTVAWTRRFVPGADVFIAGDNLLALAGLWLRTRGLVDTVILYSIDYVPRRFRNPLLNRAYHAVDAFTAGHADVLWDVSAEIAAARSRRDGAQPGPPNVVVPVGAHVERVRRLALAEAEPHRIAFMGHLLEKQGVQLAIEALPAVRATVPDATLLVMGDGPYRRDLKQCARRMGVADAVEFTGYIQDHAEIEARLAASAVAVAPYRPDPSSFTRFADPGKIKAYLAAGLPVVLTDVPAIAPELEAAGAGRIVAYSAPALAAAILEYLSDPSALERARAAAANMGAGFSWQAIFDTALNRTAELLG